MPEHRSHSEIRPAGYLSLIARLGLEVLPNWRQSHVAAGNTHRIDTTGAITDEIFPARYWPGEGLGDQLEFALKYDGTNLALLAHIFARADRQELVDFIASKPRGKYARRLWFLYEFLTGARLPLDDLQHGAYIDLLEPEKYYTLSPPAPSRRQRVNNNLLGDARFCPTIRRTEALRGFESTELTQRCQDIVAGYSPQLLKRAMSYLYTKETKSSFEIEHLKPSSTRTERFVALLQAAEHEDYCQKARLIDLQNRIVDPRFAAADYRQVQNYVGQSVAWQREKVHYVSPKPADLPDLMAGLLSAHERMSQSRLHPVLHAAAVAYGFVYLHPFDDGNGRIHRFLIHNILARRGFTPPGMIFPISAAMLKNLAGYDASLEGFSRPLLAVVEYSLDDEGRMTVLNDTASWYRYVDLTMQAEAMFGFIQQTIESELVEELAFLANYDQTKQALQDIVDMPDRQLDHFIRTCLQNNGRLSTRKRDSHFAHLSAEEIERMEAAIRSANGSGRPPTT